MAAHVYPAKPPSCRPLLQGNDGIGRQRRATPDGGAVAVALTGIALRGGVTRTDVRGQ